MSGHSKWSTIKRKKESKDKQKGKIFSRISREITVSVREGGSSEVSNNARLRLALQNAKSSNLPKSVIDKAIRKGEGHEAESYAELNYEGYGSSGVALYIECMSDNSQRTLSDVRHLLHKHGGRLSGKGSLDFIFKRKGIFFVQHTDIETDEALNLLLIDAGAEGIENGEDEGVIVCPLAQFGAIHRCLEEAKVSIIRSELIREATHEEALSKEAYQRIRKLIDALEEHDDVQQVFHNMKVSEEQDDG